MGKKAFLEPQCVSWRCNYSVCQVNSVDTSEQEACSKNMSRFVINNFLFISSYSHPLAILLSLYIYHWSYCEKRPWVSFKALFKSKLFLLLLFYWAYKKKTEVYLYLIIISSCHNISKCSMYDYFKYILFYVS